jgi:hypothetical protein
VRLWDVATHLARAGQAQPIFQLVLRAAHTRPRRHRFASNLLAPPNQSDCQSDCQSIEAAAGDHLGTPTNHAHGNRTIVRRVKDH